jgi:hypothetical protein
MSKRAVRIGHYLLIGILFISLGGHLAVFQTIAWATMLKDFSRSASLEEAAQKTFSGEHPCPLCKAVSESKKQEEKKTLLKAESKMEVALPTPVRLKSPRGVSVEIHVPGYYGQGSVVSLGVPLQPPRSA